MAEATLDNEQIIRLKMEIKMSEAYLQQELTPVIQENLERYTGHFIPPMAQDWDVVGCGMLIRQRKPKLITHITNDQMDNTSQRKHLFGCAAPPHTTPRDTTPHTRTLSLTPPRLTPTLTNAWHTHRPHPRTPSDASHSTPWRV